MSTIKSLSSASDMFCTIIDVILKIPKVVTDSVNLDDSNSSIVMYDYEVLSYIDAATQEILTALLGVYRSSSNLLDTTPWIGAIVSNGINDDPSSKLLRCAAGASAYTEMFTLEFIDTTGFTVIGSVSGPVGSGSTSTDFTSSGDGDLIIPAATISDLFRGTFAAEDKIFISVNKWNKQIASIAANLAAGEIMRSISYSEVISPDDSISYRFTNKAKGMLDRLQRPFAVDGARLSTLPSMPVDDIQLGNWDGDVYDKFGQINTDYISDSDVLNYNS